MKRVLCFLLLSLSLVTGLHADVLVLHDGSRIDTLGAYEQKDERVTFKDAQGRLMALRASEVDFAATTLANQPVQAKPAAVVSAKVEPVLVLTDKDIPEGDSDEAAGESSAESRVTLYMTDWCGYCRKTERLLDELEVSYETINVEKVPGARQEKSRLQPGCGVPVTVIADTAICGYSERKIRSLVEEMKQSESTQDNPREGEA